MNIRHTFETFILILLANLTLFAGSDPDLKTLYQNKKYFELRAEIEKSSSTGAEFAFFQGAVANKFNDPGKSINFLNQYLGNTANDTAASFREAAYEILADNYIKSYKYDKAVDAYKILMENFSAKLDSSKIADIENSIKLWGCFLNAPPQKVELTSDVKLKLKSDKAGLKNLPVIINSKLVDFVFDTGAGISSITKTYAEKLGLKLSQDSISVGAITGNKVFAHLGMASDISIGNAVVKNALFLVFNDADLAVTQIDYQVNGIIGFPVIEGFKEFTITTDDTLIIPAKIKAYPFRNMCLEELVPIIQAESGDKKLVFSFDTGARTSHFYKSFLDENEEYVKQNSTESTVKVAGAGGAKIIDVYNLKNFNMKISGKNVLLDPVSIWKNSVDENNKYLYGNLGQDVIKQFRRMTLNFESMCLIFE